MNTEDELLRKLDIIAQLLAMNLLKDKSVADQIKHLNEIGFKSKEIAKILGKTEHHVHVTLSNLRKSKKTQKPKVKNES